MGWDGVRMARKWWNWGSTWKALHTAEPSYLSELISPYAPTRTLRSVNTGLLVQPTGVTSHFASRSFCCFFSISLEFSTCTRSPVLLVIFLHLSVILNHTFSSQLSLSSHPAPAPPIRSLRYWCSINLAVCMYVCCRDRLYEWVSWINGVTVETSYELDAVHWCKTQWCL